MVFLPILIFQGVRSDIKTRQAEKAATLLEWRVPRPAWHVTEKFWFSPLFLGGTFVVYYAVFFLLFGYLTKYHPPEHVTKDTLVFSDLPWFCALMSAMILCIYGSIWFWAKVKTKLTIHGIEKDFHNSGKTLKYRMVKDYYFKPIQVKSTVYQILVLHDHKGKTHQFALDNESRIAEIERILTDHGIQKNITPHF